MNPFGNKQIYPRNDFILIEKKHRNVTEGGIALAEGSAGLPNWLGTIVAVGPGLMQFVDNPGDLAEHRDMIVEGLQSKHNGNGALVKAEMDSMDTSERKGWYLGCHGLWVGAEVIFFYHAQVMDNLDLEGGFYLVRENNIFAVLIDPPEKKPKKLDAPDELVTEVAE